MGNLRYTIISDSSYTNPLDLIKEKWNELELDATYLIQINSTSAYVALVQKYEMHSYGSVFIMSYTVLGEHPIYARLRNNTWIDTFLITNNDLCARILGISNLNEIKSPGIYSQNNSHDATIERNYPAEDVGFLEVMAVDNSDFVLQKYNTHSSSTVYKRTYTNSKWNSWKQV